MEIEPPDREAVAMDIQTRARAIATAANDISRALGRGWTTRPARIRAKDQLARLAKEAGALWEIV